MSSEGDNESPWSKDKAKKFETKPHSKYYDPCQDAASRSIKCLQRNAGDKEMCQDFFQAYRDCKKEWIEQRRANSKGWFG
ncbi:Mitochondrial copper homeostasis protein [Venturia effusa]|uniref:Mitochondrial copper homeostasis protein n=1 Tax=Venturia effusa TaxID=50376 RepID=A0A517KW87_9PEZI|nr:Mitochondrial copper homeostasis protein [Venturia effusa]